MQNNTLKTIGKRIQEARISCNMNQSDLARKLGVRPQSVQHWERGTTLPKSSRINALAEALNIHPSWLLLHHDEQQPSLANDSLEFEEIMLIRKYRNLDANQQHILDGIVNVLLDTPDTNAQAKRHTLKPK